MQQTKVPASQNVKITWEFKKSWSHASCTLGPSDEKGFSCLAQFKKTHPNELWVRTAGNINEAFENCIQSALAQLKAQKSQLEQAMHIVVTTNDLVCFKDHIASSLFHLDE